MLAGVLAASLADGIAPYASRLAAPN